MTKELKADVCIIGAGAGGLSIAAAAAQLNLKTVLVEQGKMGGDCLNYGCVPSKALLHVASIVAQKKSAPFGLSSAPEKVDFITVTDYLRNVIATIAPHDSVERFEGLGVSVFKERARFLDSARLTAGNVIVTARRFVVATGSRPFIPSIPGLSDIPYLTNETIFDLSECPEHLIIVGGGAIGVEMAQAFRRLGAEVTLIETGRILAREDGDGVKIIRSDLQRAGVTIKEGYSVASIRRQDGKIIADIVDKTGEKSSHKGSHLLVATGRRATVDGLDLDKAGVAYTEKGITVDGRLRTSNPRIYAVGDVLGGPQFTHLAGQQAGFFVRSSLFGLPGRRQESIMPRCLYTDPELAQVGLTAVEAEKQNLQSRILTWPLAKNDRAIATGATAGFVKIIADRRGRLKGATIVGPHAGELIYTYSLALNKKLKLSALAGAVAPYPTLAEAGRRAAGEFYAPAVFGRLAQLWVRFRSQIG